MPLAIGSKGRNVNEQEWLECTNPTPMLEHVLDRTSTRKLRLLACAWSRFIGQNHLAVAVRQKLIEIGERYADNIATEEEVNEGRRLANSRGAYQALNLMVTDDIARRLIPVFNHEYILGQGPPPPYCMYAHDIFGNPFRPITIDPRWLTSTVIDLATAIYDERAFDRMPVLADALTDAGCDNEEIIAHCRNDGEHVRGCWVVDLLLRKE